MEPDHEITAPLPFRELVEASIQRIDSDIGYAVSTGTHGPATTRRKKIRLVDLLNFADTSWLNSLIKRSEQTTDHENSICDLLDGHSVGDEEEDTVELDTITEQIFFST